MPGTEGGAGGSERDGDWCAERTGQAVNRNAELIAAVGEAVNTPAVAAVRLREHLLERVSTECGRPAGMCKGGAEAFFLVPSRPGLICVRASLIMMVSHLVFQPTVEFEGMV